MTERFTADHLVATVPGLTPDRLLGFLEAALVVPKFPEAARFSRADLARVQFLCELSDDLGLEEPSLAVVIALVDTLHTARNDLYRLALAIQAEPPAVRSRIGMVLRQGPP